MHYIWKLFSWSIGSFTQYKSITLRFPNSTKTPRSCHNTHNVPAVYIFRTPHSETSMFSFIVLTPHSSLQLDYFTVYAQRVCRVNSRPWAAETLLLTFVLNSRPMTSWLKQNIVTDTVLNAIKTSLWIVHVRCSCDMSLHFVHTQTVDVLCSYYRSFYAADDERFLIKRVIMYR